MTSAHLWLGGSISNLVFLTLALSLHPRGRVSRAALLVIRIEAVLLTWFLWLVSYCVR